MVELGLLATTFTLHHKAMLHNRTTHFVRGLVSPRRRVAQSATLHPRPEGCHRRLDSRHTPHRQIATTITNASLRHRHVSRTTTQHNLLVCTIVSWFPMDSLFLSPPRSRGALSLPGFSIPPRPPSNPFIAPHARGVGAWGSAEPAGDVFPPRLFCT